MGKYLELLGFHPLKKGDLGGDLRISKGKELMANAIPGKTANSCLDAYLCLTLKALVIIVGLARIGAGGNSWFGDT
jgi:hypothetical protein